jgi:hypothetical protein
MEGSRRKTEIWKGDGLEGKKLGKGFIGGNGKIKTDKNVESWFPKTDHLRGRVCMIILTEKH